MHICLTNQIELTDAVFKQGVFSTNPNRIGGSDRGVAAPAGLQYTWKVGLRCGLLMLTIKLGGEAPRVVRVSALHRCHSFDL